MYTLWYFPVKIFVYTVILEKENFIKDYDKDNYLKFEVPDFEMFPSSIKCISDSSCTAHGDFILQGPGKKILLWSCGNVDTHVLFGESYQRR